MAETATGASAKGEPAPLDDVMLAMDVVDTLRHREHVISRELGEGARESDLLDRLRKIYTAQGIEVSDRILKEGVEGLKRSRFVYDPPASNLSVWLARLYVARIKWGKAVGVVALVIALGWAGYNWGWRIPGERSAEAARIELAETLPRNLEVLAGQVAALAEIDEARGRAEALLRTGRAAAAAGNREAAAAALGDLEALKSALEREYEIRIVTGQDQQSGVWRIPDVNQDARNYYLIVEALTAKGERLALPIRNEEDGQLRTVEHWGQRVPEATFDRVRRDKQDDGIIQNNLIGAKQRGHLEPDFTIPVDGGTITGW